MRSSIYVLMLSSLGFGSIEAPVEEMEPKIQCEQISEVNSDALYLLAAYVLSETDAPLTPSELVNQYQHLRAGFDMDRCHYQLPYAAYFDAEETRDVYELACSGLFGPYGQQLSQLSQEEMEETLHLLHLLVHNAKKQEASQAQFPIIQVDQTTLSDLLSSSRPVIIDVYTDWCGPCRLLAPCFKELNNELGDRYQFAKLNAEKESAIARSFKISAVPTIIFIKDGNEVGRHIGFMDKREFLKEIENHLE